MFVRRRMLAVVVILLCGATLALTWFVVTKHPYKPGSPFGYNLGLIGGLMMLTLLLYPLRKRFAALDRLGSMTGWFKHHMAFGILAPLLILFHSTFRPVSINGRVALYSMLVVVASGIIGRFIYRHVHAGIYGKELTLADREKALLASAKQVDASFALQPDVLQGLRSFRDEAMARNKSFLQRTWRFLTLRVKARMLRRSTRASMRRAFRETSNAQHWTNAQKRLAARVANRQVAAYLDAVCQTASHATWQHLFSLWHLLHIPFLYLLIISAIIHIIAVHMY